jgi:phosphoribosyl 1,2-cyclic phosphodiesterase
VRVLLGGVRGSTPAAGPDFVRYGGNTSCVAVARDEDDLPSVILDAGTGLQNLRRVFGESPFRGSILLGHLHWDHTHGLPFFPPADRPDARVRLHLPAQGDPVEVISRVMAPPHFPIGPAQLRGEWSFVGLEPGHHRVEGFDVLAREVPHKGGRTFGYRISDGSGSIAYISDHCPTAIGPGADGLGELHAAALELADGVDLLLHDAQYTAAELPSRADYGHAAVEYAIALAERAGAATLVLFHHDPWRTDNELDAIVVRAQEGPVPVIASRDGLVLPVGAVAVAQQ